MKKNKTSEYSYDSYKPKTREYRSFFPTEAFEDSKHLTPANYDSKVSKVFSTTLDQKHELMEQKNALLLEIQKHRQVSEELAIREHNLQKQEKEMAKIVGEIEDLNKEIAELEEVVEESKTKSILIQKTQEIQLMNSKIKENAFRELEKLKEIHQDLLLQYEVEKQHQLENKRYQAVLEKQEQAYNQTINEIEKIQRMNESLSEKIGDYRAMAEENSKLMVEIEDIQAKTREQVLNLEMTKKEHEALASKLKNNEYNEVIKEKQRLEAIKRQQIEVFNKNQIEFQHLTQENQLIVKELDAVVSQAKAMKESKRERKARLKQERRIQEEIEMQRRGIAEVANQNALLTAELQRKKLASNPMEMKRQITEEVNLYNDQINLQQEHQKATKEMALLMKKNAEMEEELAKLSQREKYYSSEKERLMSEARRTYEEKQEAEKQKRENEELRKKLLRDKYRRG